MPAATVLILSSQPLFAESLASLFQRDGYDVTGIGPYSHYVPRLSGRMQPDLIVVDTHDAPPNASVELLTCAPNARVLRVSLDENLISLYDGRLPASQDSHDFVDYFAFRKEWQLDT